MFKIITALSTCALLLPSIAMDNNKRKAPDSDFDQAPVQKTLKSQQDGITESSMPLYEDFADCSGKDLYDIAMAYKEDEKTKRNEQLTVCFLEFSAEKGCIEAAYELALYYLSSNLKEDKVIEQLKIASYTENSHATYLLHCYHQKKAQYLKKKLQEADFLQIIDLEFNIQIEKDLSYDYLKSAAYKKHPTAIYKAINYLKKHYYNTRKTPLYDALIFLDVAAEQTEDPKLASWAHTELEPYYKDLILNDINKYFAVNFLKRQFDKTKNPLIAYKLSTLYRKGGAVKAFRNLPFIEKNPEKAFEYLLEAGNLKHGKALFHLGMHYLNGNQVNKSIEQALLYFDESAEQPPHRFTVNAMFEAGKIYKEAEDSRSLILAFNYFEQVVVKLKTIKSDFDLVVQKDVLSSSLVFLVYFYKIGVPSINHFPKRNSLPTPALFVKKNPEKAFSLLMEASKLGHKRADCLLALFYKDGFGIEKNPAQAFFYYSKAVNNPPFCCLQPIYWLGIFYKNGFGVKQSSISAANFFRKGADLGHNECQYELALCYKNGIGVEKDDKNFIEWLKKAALRSMNANIELAKLSFNGEMDYYIPQNYISSFVYFALAHNIHIERGHSVTKKMAETILDTLGEEKAEEFLFDLISMKSYHLAINLYPFVYKKTITETIEKAKKGDAKACYILGILYYESEYYFDKKNCVQDFEKSVYWASEAHKQDRKYSLWFHDLIKNRQEKDRELITKIEKPEIIESQTFESAYMVSTNFLTSRNRYVVAEQSPKIIGENQIAIDELFDFLVEKKVIAEKWKDAVVKEIFPPDEDEESDGKDDII